MQFYGYQVVAFCSFTVLQFLALRIFRKLLFSAFSEYFLARNF
jgi:hypothetical protein